MSNLHLIAWIVALATPLSAVVFLTSFLVWLGQGSHDTWFTRACDRAVGPSAALTVGLVIVTLVFF